MGARLLDGKEMAAAVRQEVARRVANLAAERGVVPGLAVILIGRDPASEIYVRNKERAAAEVGIRSFVHRLPAEVGEGAVLELIAALNTDPAVHGILIQAPVPGHLDFEALVAAVDPAKDVDGFHPANLGRLARGRAALVPCTPKGVMAMLRRAGIDPSGREAVVVGRSTIVGKPMALMLVDADATVTVCHSRTRRLEEHTRRADILVVAAGRPGLISRDMVKPGAVVVDVGINRVEGRIVGDVDFEGVREVAGWLTPVPGGVGPMTVAMLLENTLEAAAAALGA